ncbi:MAG: gamma-glutamyltransferase [Anaerolineae bacterium]
MPNMIVAPQPLAVEEGAKVLMAGGNAVDAAVTAALVQGVVSPQMCGIGGYILLTLRLAGQGQQTIALDAPALAGSGVTPDMWQGLVIRPNPRGWGFFLRGKVNEIGYGSICTPGAVKGLSAMIERWGSISWEQATLPARRIAEAGFAVDSYLAAGWRDDADSPETTTLLGTIKANDEARRIYLHADGTPQSAGEMLQNPDYADSLAILADAGPDDFYHGGLAADMAADLAGNGSYVTRDDLATYELRDVPPVTGDYRGYAVASSPAPHGGPTLIAMLNILEGYDLASLGHNSPGYIRLVAMAMRAAFADRNPYLGDPYFVDVPVDWMTSKERAAHWRQRIDRNEEIRVAFTPTEPPDTTHVSVVDARGNCVSLTHSLGMSSGVITPGLGFMYNNSMVNFHPIPGHPNSIAPGKSRTTGMTPTIVYRDGEPVLVIGAPGATRIITSVLQVLLNVLDFDMSISDAVAAPRFDCQVGPIRTQARIPEFVCAEVRRYHPIERMPESHGGHGLVHAIAIDRRSGRLSGAADTGAGGMALEV